jgi:DNA polymerase
LGVEDGERVFRLPGKPRTLAALNRLIAASAPPFAGSSRAVLGEGQPGAAIAFVGEQPGDQEDKEGRPFVGPAGRLLDKLMSQAGLARERAYLTNAVKHFKFEQPASAACTSAPQQERSNTTAGGSISNSTSSARALSSRWARALCALAGRTLSISAHRGPIAFGQRAGYVTVHPSMLLRIPDAVARRAERACFLSDLKRIRALAEAIPSAQPRSARRRSPAHAPPPAG